MRCPDCQSRELRINVVLSGTVTFRFNDDQSVDPLETGALDSFWGPEAECSCANCAWRSIAAFAAAEDDFLRMLPYADQELASLDRLLEDGHCPAPVAARIADLRDVVRRQSEIIQSLHRVVSTAAPVVDRKQPNESRAAHPRRDKLGAEGGAH